MGRGRAKAKQTKVARELKYHSPNTDLTALQRELAGASGKSDRHFDDDNDEFVDDDEDDADDDQDTWSPTRR
ncbi:MULTISPECIES: DUF3073 domain-containing protein [Micromonosporaceae]|jgi:DUF3073 family protein|uniref:DUF3073 domain-containing protein n=1 Tax=Paractinoplanes durhamensis TaxID=113563 RepID=A0ABQ3ZCB9_9ACTN|nr:DUF3073 domain-containing protein [Actinoplanes durhamensis]GIE07447.1 hypothetical protein Adu01nite_87970 [Actinoplanes durhamensis]